MKRQIRKDMVRNLLLSQVQVTKKGDIISISHKIRKL